VIKNSHRDEGGKVLKPIRASFKQRGNVAHVVMGSVATKVIATLKVPVLRVR
jgi:nucleotide-binding universal stress UspA family protein